MNKSGNKKNIWLQILILSSFFQLYFVKKITIFWFLILLGKKYNSIKNWHIYLDFKYMRVTSRCNYTIFFRRQISHDNKQKFFFSQITYYNIFIYSVLNLILLGKKATHKKKWQMYLRYLQLKEFRVTSRVD